MGAVIPALNAPRRSALRDASGSVRTTCGPGAAAGSGANGAIGLPDPQPADGLHHQRKAVGHVRLHAERVHQLQADHIRLRNLSRHGE